MNNFAVILAAGSGSRMESHSMPKCFIKVNDKEIYKYSLETFLKEDQIGRIVLVVPFDFYEAISFAYKSNEKVSVIKGGTTRQESVFNALNYLKTLAKDDDVILIHDAARPLVTSKIIIDNINECQKVGACLTVIKSIDTIVKTSDFISVSEIPDRSCLYSEQTPASFRYKDILNAHENAIKYQLVDASDDCTLMMQQGHKINFVNGSRYNFKITNEIDLALFKLIIDGNDNLN